MRKLMMHPGQRSVYFTKSMLEDVKAIAGRADNDRSISSIIGEALRMLAHREHVVDRAVKAAGRNRS